MPKDISSSHEGREQRSDAPPHDVARSHGKVRDFATRPQTHQYANGDYFTLRSGERVLRLRGGADDEGYGDPYNTRWDGDNYNTGWWYDDSYNTGWHDDPYRHEDPYRYEDPSDQWRKEPASTSDIYSEASELWRERPGHLGDERRENDADPYSARDRASWSLPQWIDELGGKSSISNVELQQLRASLTHTGNESRESEELRGENEQLISSVDEEVRELLQKWEIENPGKNLEDVWQHDGGEHDGGQGDGHGGEDGGKLIGYGGDGDDSDSDNENIIPLSNETPAVGHLIIDPGRTLSPEELAFAEFLVQEGHVVIAVAEGHTRTSDYLVDGVATELKTVSQITTKDVSGALGRTLLHGAGQAAHIIADTRQQAEVTLEVAERAIRRAYGVDNKYATDNNVPPRLQQIRIIGKDFDITRPRV
jgi:hypothetical protein